MSQGCAFNPTYPTIHHSDAMYARLVGLIPAGTQTLAKGVGQFTDGVAPKFLVRGKGARVFDPDGNEYLDYNMGVGPISLGYAYPRVDDAIRRQLEDGITFSLVHPLEVEVAELVRAVVPNAECVRYSKTGCDVTSAAVRLARAHTKRNKILCCGYHGWHDWYISVTDRNAGIPDAVASLTYTFNYNDIDGLEASLDDDVAAVILEPVVFDEPKNDFLKKVREQCTKKGVVLIFDEMWTGFRLALGGAQQYYGVTPDLACFSKACANGMPLSILTGKREIMRHLEHDVFFFTTFGGETLSLAAAKATIEELRDKNVPEVLHRRGARLRDGYNAIATELGMTYTRCIGVGPRTLVTFEASAGQPLEMKTLVQQELLKCGILWAGFHNLCFSHSDEDIQYTLSAYRNVLPSLKQAVADGNIQRFLKGKILEPVFRKTSNFNTKPNRR